LKRKQNFIGPAADALIDLDEGWINSDGWFAPTNGVDNAQPQRLFWVPGIHWSGLYRPSNTCVIGGQNWILKTLFMARSGVNACWAVVDRRVIVIFVKFKVCKGIIYCRLKISTGSWKSGKRISPTQIR